MNIEAVLVPITRAVSIEPDILVFEWLPLNEHTTTESDAILVLSKLNWANAPSFI